MSAHVSAAEAARMYGLSEKTVRRWIRSGRLGADKRDGTYSVALDDVSALAAKVPAHGSAPLSAPVSAQESAPGADMPSEDVRPTDVPGTDIMRAEAMASYTRSVLEPLVAALERSQARVAELEREAGTYAERMAGLERVRDAAMAHAAELEAKLEAAAARPPEPDAVEEVASLRAEHDRHTAELARADATLAGQAASHARVSRQVRRLWIALAVATVLALVAVAAPAWVR